MTSRKQEQGKALEEKLNAQLATIQKRDAQVAALEEKVSAQAASLREGDAEAEKTRKRLAQLERRIRDEMQQRAKSDETLRVALKDLTKIGKWADRLLQNYQRVLKSNRWRIGCWLSLKRAGEKSKEAQRLAQLVASRPLPASVGKDVSPAGASTGKGKPDAPTRPSPESGKRDASLRRDSGGQARLAISAAGSTAAPKESGPVVPERVSSGSASHGYMTHPETWMERNELGKARPYRPTFTGFDQFINDKHRYYNECPTKGIVVEVGIEGRLRREDALKLYEMAYYAAGDILEFGTNRGLSISILARAVRDAGKNSQLVTMELLGRLAEHARRTLSELDLSSHIEFMVGDADVSCQKLIDAGRKFHFAFVDHSHAYDDVVKACRRLYQLLVPGSFCLFHDYNDPREGTADYGVYTAVAQTLDKNHFEFCGIYGCCGLFRRREA